MGKEAKLFEEADYGSIESFNSALEQVDANCKNEIGQTALHIVAIYGNALKSKSLLDKGADSTVKDYDGETPLVAAISYMFSEERVFSDYTGVIALLVRAGNNVEESDFLRYEAPIKLNMVITFIRLIKEGVDEDTASANSMSQNYLVPIVTEEEDDEDEVIILVSNGSQEVGDSDSNIGKTEHSRKKAKHSHNDDGANGNGERHHSNSINLNDNDDITKHNKQTYQEEIIETGFSFSEVMLQELYAWIYELPEWMQNQILNSTPVKEMIISAEQMSVIYDIKSIAQDFATRVLASDPGNNSVDVVEDDMYEMAQIHDLRPMDLIDMSMKLIGPAVVSGWILPMVSMESSIFAGDISSSGLVHLQGHGIDVF